MFDFFVEFLLQLEFFVLKFQICVKWKNIYSNAKNLKVFFIIVTSFWKFCFFCCRLKNQNFPWISLKVLSQIFAHKNESKHFTKKKIIYFHDFTIWIQCAWRCEDNARNPSFFLLKRFFFPIRKARVETGHRFWLVFFSLDCDEEPIKNNVQIESKVHQKKLNEPKF